MIPSNRFSVFIVTFLVFGFLFTALPEKGYSGNPMPPVELGCCQFSGINGGSEIVDNRLELYECTDQLDIQGCAKAEGEFFPGAECIINTGMCSQIQPTRNVPTLSEWGLITMAAILGVIGFMVIRRRKAAV